MSFNTPFPLPDTEVSITGATTLTSSALSRSLSTLLWHVCSGTTSNYTVTLPTAASVAGYYLAIRMSTALTKMVTLDGNSTETIDGSTTRVMWAGESAVLFSDGSNWFKVAGRSVPMIGRIGLNASQTISSATVTTVTFNRSISDNAGLMVNTGSNRLDVQRSGLYVLSFSMEWSGLTAAATRLQTFPLKNGATGLFNADMTAAAGGSPTVIGSRVESLVATDYMQIRTYQDTGSDQTLFGQASGACSELGLQEVIQW